MESYSWPGNVRELQSVLKQALLHASGTRLLPEFLPESIRTTKPTSSTDELFPTPWDRFLRNRLRQGSDNLYAETLELMERHLLTVTLKETGGNQLRAAGILGMTRGTLRNKLKSLGISIDRIVASESSS